MFQLPARNAAALPAERRSRRTHGGKIPYIAAAALAVGLGWASVAKLDQISRAPGQIIPVGRVQVVQSADGGEIARLMVQEGDAVRRGQVLVQLDKVKIQAAVDEGEAKVAALLAQQSRVAAELFDRPLEFPEQVRRFPDFERSQRQLYAQRRTSLGQQVGALQTMLGLARQELEMNQPLLQYGDVSRSEIMRLQRQIAELQSQIVNTRNKYLQDLQVEYTKVGEDLVTAQETLTQRKAALESTEIVAPTDGIVKNVRLTTIGGVLRPGDEVMQIVPTGQELIVEAKVSPADIAYVRTGQAASVKFDAFDSSIYGSAQGKVAYVSPDTLAEGGPGGAERVGLSPWISSRFE